MSHACSCSLGDVDVSVALPTGIHGTRVGRDRRGQGIAAKRSVRRQVGEGLSDYGCGRSGGRDFSLLRIERPLYILTEPLERFRQLTDVEYLVFVYGHKGECRFATECSR